MEIKDRILKTERVDWREIKDLQPENLKEKDNHTFLKDSLKKYGFSKAFDVWQDPITEQIYFCDGHSRAYILKELEQDGYNIPTFLTCNFLNVNTEKEAIQVLLEVHSQKQNAIKLEVLEVWCEAKEVEVNVESVNVVLQDAIIDEVDYSLLDGDDNIDKQLEEMANGVKKAIQIEFEPEHYLEAYELVKFWREKGAYVGKMILDFFKAEKNKI